VTGIDRRPADWRHLDLPTAGSTNAEAMALAAEGDPGNLWVTAANRRRDAAAAAVTGRRRPAISTLPRC
jgi:hypothetical protein